MKNKNLKFLPISTISILTLIVIIALPYPFTTVNIFLEKIIRKDLDTCDCLCPWWIFSIWQILSSLIVFQFEKAMKQEKKSKYIFKIFTIGVLTWFLHLILHLYYLNKGILTYSVFCTWFWLITFVIALILSFLNPIKKEK